MNDKTISIGGACGYWGESNIATPQFLKQKDVQYIVYDYLAEITMSILARAKAKRPENGYAPDFISAVLKPNLSEIATKGIRLVSNAGGVNPHACGAAIVKLVKELGLDLKVAVISGDNILDQAHDIAKTNPVEMFTGDTFPDPEKIASINTYLGAFPIAKALDQGADIVVTGRCVDSAVTLGICIHEFKWRVDDYHHLASGSLAGHILECGPQACGGNFTPIAHIKADGSFEITKPEHTTGLVSIGTISEQMLYEIGDPQAYILPDVICDFSAVQITQKGQNLVHVSPAIGHAPPSTYKTCLTYADGYRTGMMLTHYGFDAAKKSAAYAEAALKRARTCLKQLNLSDFTKTSIEIIGTNSQYGDYHPIHSSPLEPSEVVVKIAAKHPTLFEGGILLKELVGLGLTSAPGLSGFQGARPKPSPIIRLFSYLTEKSKIEIEIDVDGRKTMFHDINTLDRNMEPIKRPAAPTPPHGKLEMTSLPLIKLAWGRSGDKGNKANIGIIARQKEFLPYIWETLTEEKIARRFAHFIETGGDPNKVDRYYLSGSHAINFLIDGVLGGGGVSSIRNDPQGKGFAQILLTEPIRIPISLAHQIEI